MDIDKTRSGAARAGIVLLNLLWPGLGVLRTGAVRAGLAWMAAMVGLLGLYVAAAALLPQWTLTTYYTVIAVVMLGTLATCGGAMAASWRRSRTVSALPFFSRWYGLVLVYVAAQALIWPVLPLAQSFYKPFFAPASSMAPTIDIGDNMLVDMRRIDPIRAGDIVVFRSRVGIMVKRVVALPGQRIAVHDGLPFIDGQPVRQVPTGRSRTAALAGRPLIMREFEETLPGERGRHLVYDAGAFVFDEFAEQTVLAGRYFVLGDNRDNSEDSRISGDIEGVGMPSRSDIIGKPLFIHYGANRGRVLSPAAAGVEPPRP